MRLMRLRLILNFPFGCLRFRERPAAAEKLAPEAPRDGWT
jgi:hypothetical protein